MNGIFEKLAPPPPKVTVGINGFGRIGRAFLRIAAETKDIDVVAINDLGDIQNLAYLLKYDTAYKSPSFKVEAGDGHILVGRKKVKVLNEKDPSAIPWKKLGVDVVVESTGVFESFEKASGHLRGGASRVVITAPLKNEPGATGPLGETVLVGVNEEALGASVVTSNASCTTNAGSPLIAILDETLGIEKALLSTVHAYTATQSIVDSPVKGTDLRRGRAAGQNIVPSSTGAATAVTEAYPKLKGFFDGISLRVPVVTGSIVDITFISKKSTSAEEVNSILGHAAQELRWRGIFTTTREQLVSSDIIGNPHASIADLNFTRVVGGNLVKVLAWYDNEIGYTNTLMRHVRQAGQYIH